MPDPDAQANLQTEVQTDPLADMLARLLRFREERDWRQFHNPKDQALGLLLEAAEVLELTQWKNGPELDAHLTDRQEDLADELADVLGWVLLIAHDRGINLPDAFERKLIKNERKYPTQQVRGSAKKYTDYKTHSPDER